MCGHSILYPRTPTSTPWAKFSKGAVNVISGGFLLKGLGRKVACPREGILKDKSSYFGRGLHVSTVGGGKGGTKWNVPTSKKG